MVYYRDPNLDKDKEAGASQITSSTGEQAGLDGQAAQGQAPGTQAPTGSKFTNIENYLQGGAGKQFGQEFGGKIQSDITGAKEQIDTSAGKVKGQIAGSGYVPTQEEINKTISGAGSGTTPEQEAKYRDWTTQAYKGPTGVADTQGAWNDYWGKANRANTEAKQAGTESGRFALLDQYYGRPNYSFGQKSLDNLMLQGGGGFQNQADLQNQATGLNAYGAEQATGIENAASQRAADIAASKQAARSAVGLQSDNTVGGGAIGALQEGLNNRVNQYNTEQQNQYNKYASDLSKDNINRITQNLTGLQGGENLYNLDLSKYLTHGSVGTANALINPDERSKYNALSRMAGVDPTLFSPEGSTAPLTKNAFNQEDFKRDQAQAKYDYERALDSPVSDPDPYVNGMSPNQMSELINRWTGGTGVAADAGGKYVDLVKGYQNYLNKFNSDRKINRKININDTSAAAQGGFGGLAGQTSYR